MLVAEAGDAPGPFAFDVGPALELEAEGREKLDRSIEIVDDDPHIVEALDRHDASRPRCGSS